MTITDGLRVSTGVPGAELEKLRADVEERVKAVDARNETFREMTGGR